VRPRPGPTTDHSFRFPLPTPDLGERAGEGNLRNCQLCEPGASQGSSSGRTSCARGARGAKGADSPRTQAAPHRAEYPTQHQSARKPSSGSTRFPTAMAVFSVRRSSARSPRLSVALRIEIPASKIPEIRRAGRGFEVKPGSRLRQLGLAKRSAHRPENFLKSQQSCHLMRQPCLPKRGETRFLSTDCGLQPLARLAPEFQFLADGGDQVPEFIPSFDVRCQRSYRSRGSFLAGSARARVFSVAISSSE
jgi:hypothetical protein